MSIEDMCVHGDFGQTIRCDTTTIKIDDPDYRYVVWMGDESITMTAGDLWRALEFLARKIGVHDVVEVDG